MMAIMSEIIVNPPIFLPASIPPPLLTEWGHNLAMWLTDLLTFLTTDLLTFLSTDSLTFLLTDLLTFYTQYSVYSAVFLNNSGLEMSSPKVRGYGAFAFIL